MAYALSPESVLRAEPQSALWFHRRSAETLELDLQGLEMILTCLKGGRLWSWRAWALRNYLLARGFLRRSSASFPEQIEHIEFLIRRAQALQAPLRSRTAPEVLQLALTDACPQSCQGCFFSNQTVGQPSRYLPPRRFTEILHQARDLGVFQLAFGGGEPLMHPQLLNYVKDTSQAGLVPNLTSSGLLLDPDRAQALKRAGLGQFQLSLNGAQDTTHALTRPHYNKVWRAIDICRQAELRWGVNILLTRALLPDLERLFAQLQSAGVWAVNLIRPKAAQDNPDWLARVQPRAEDYRALQPVLKRWQRRGRFILQSDSSLSFLRQGSLTRLRKQGVAGCSAGRRMLSIAVDGRATSCGHLPQHAERGSLAEIWWKSAHLERFRRLEEELQGQCGSCEQREVCRGCRAVVLAEGRDFTGEDRQCPKHLSI